MTDGGRAVQSTQRARPECLSNAMPLISNIAKLPETLPVGNPAKSIVRALQAMEVQGEEPTDKTTGDRKRVKLLPNEESRKKPVVLWVGAAGQSDHFDAAAVRCGCLVSHATWIDHPELEYLNVSEQTSWEATMDAFKINEIDTMFTIPPTVTFCQSGRGKRWTGVVLQEGC